MNQPASIPIRKLPPAPSCLGKAGKAHWTAVLSLIPDLDPPEFARLLDSCIMRDRAAAFRADIEKRGEIVPDRFGILRPNLSVDKERAAMELSQRLDRELGIGTDAVAPHALPPKGFR